MKNTKTEHKWFSPIQWKDEENYLRQQHKDGWEFVKVTAFDVYHFRKCEPRDVVYKLDYLHRVKSNKQYIQCFSDCGWEYLQDHRANRYFRKDVSQEVETQEDIFMPDDTRLKRIVTNNILYLILGILIISDKITDFFGDAALSNALTVMHCIVIIASLATMVYAIIGLIRYCRFTKKE